jgi:catechol 2,3-dioxygenase-like lactoylglutathione lyase family enzyme
MIYPGTVTLCLRADDLQRAKLFYARLGFSVVEEVANQRVVLQHGSFKLALMSFLDANVINFRGGDAFAIQAHMKQAFPDLEGEAEHYTAEKYDATADGACWATRDPAGNEVLFDTHAGEQGPAYVRRRTGEILAAALSELEALGADTPFMDTLRSEVRTQTETR